MDRIENTQPAHVMRGMRPRGIQLTSTMSRRCRLEDRCQHWVVRPRNLLRRQYAHVFISRALLVSRARSASCMWRRRTTHAYTRTPHLVCLVLFEYLMLSWSISVKACTMIGQIGPTSSSSFFWGGLLPGRGRGLGREGPCLGGTKVPMSWSAAIQTNSRFCPCASASKITGCSSNLY